MLFIERHGYMLEEAQMTEKDALKKRIQAARGEIPADLVIRGCQVVNVFDGQIRNAEIAVTEGVIVGVEKNGTYEGREIVDGAGMFAIPGLIESHIHIESSHLTPEEFGRVAAIRGTTTAIADPHEIVNVCGLEGFAYMAEAAALTALDIRLMMPSCVPCSPQECSGATVRAADMKEWMRDGRVQGLAEFMNVPGILNLDEDCLDKLMTAKETGKIVDGHSPGTTGLDLTAYIAAGARTDHECATAEDLQERIRQGMYVQIRNGSACKDLPHLLPGVTPETARWCLLCSDDREPLTFLTEGDLDDTLRQCVALGLDPVTAIRMGSLNAAECYSLRDRGAIAPGRRADIVLVEDLKDFKVRKVWIEGQLTAEDGKYLLPIRRADTAAVSAGMHVKDFSAERLKLALTSDRVRVIEVHGGSVVTPGSEAVIRRKADGDADLDPEGGIAKLAVIERHHNTGKMGVALLRGYGIQRGAIAVSVAHDSHNIIAVGLDNQEIACAVEELIRMKGGAVVVKDGQVKASLPLPVAGLMSDQPAEWVAEQLEHIFHVAVDELGVDSEVDPLTTLTFMSLPVIPELKLTANGLYDVLRGEFVDVSLG